MKTRLLTTTLLFAVAMMAAAEGYDYLTIRHQDGTVTRLPAVGLTITFEDGNLKATSGENTTTLALTTLSTMQFTADDATAIGSSVAGATAIRVVGRQLYVSTPQQATVTVVNIQGMPLGQYQVNSGDSQPVASLKPGLYIIKVNNTTQKLQVK